MVGDRHPVLENLVFGLAGVLALILAYYAYARWAGARPAVPGAAPGLSAPAEGPAAAEGEDSGPGVGFSGGGAVPTVRFTEPKKRGKK